MCGSRLMALKRMGIVQNYEVVFSVVAYVNILVLSVYRKVLVLANKM